jgi:hypothetical protein
MYSRNFLDKKNQSRPKKKNIKNLEIKGGAGKGHAIVGLTHV